MALIIGDFKMKINPVHYRKTSQQHLGKRELSWPGLMVLIQGTDTQLRLSEQEQGINPKSADLQVQHYDLTSSGDEVQDFFMVLTGREVLKNELHDNFPHISYLIFQSDNAKCYQKTSLLHRILEMNQKDEDRANIVKDLHTETKNGKDSHEAHFAISMAHVTRYVNMGHKGVTPSQLVCALNLNGALGNTTLMLYIVNRKVQRKFEENSTNELHRLRKCFGQVNEIRFDDSKELMTTFEYSGLDSLEMRCTSGAMSTWAPDKATAQLIPKEEEACSDRDSDNLDAVVYCIRHGAGREWAGI